MIEKIFYRKCPIYDWAKVVIVLTDDVMESSRKRGIEAQCQARTIPNPSTKTITVVLPWSAGVGMIAHEATHVVTWILDQSGIFLSVTTDEGMVVTVNDEAMAYLMDYICNLLSKLIYFKAPSKYKKLRPKA